MDGGRAWHTERVREWLLNDPDLRRKLDPRDTPRKAVLALLVAARMARHQLAGVNFGLVDWEAVVTGDSPRT